MKKLMDVLPLLLVVVLLFGTALAEAKAAGVRVLFLLCHVGRDSLEIVEQREG